MTWQIIEVLPHELHPFDRLDEGVMIVQVRFNYARRTVSYSTDAGPAPEATVPIDAEEHTRMCRQEGRWYEWPGNAEQHEMLLQQGDGHVMMTALEEDG